VKRYFAFWVVYLVFAPVAGLFVGFIEYLTAPKVEGEYGQYLDTILGGRFYDPIDIFGMYPVSAFGMMIIAYPAFRAVVGSFKIVFSKQEKTQV